MQGVYVMVYMYACNGKVQELNLILLPHLCKFFSPKIDFYSFEI